MDFSNSECRLCFSIGKEFIDIFGEKGIILDVAATLTKHFWFKKVTTKDGLSPFICLKCLECVTSFHEFYLTIERKHRHFYEDDKSVDLETIKEELTPLNIVDDFTEQALTPQIDTEHKGGDLTHDETDLKHKADPIDDTNHGDESMDGSSEEDIPVLPKKKRRKSMRFDANRCTETIKTYFKMTCDICSFPFKSFQNAKKHHAMVHNQTGYLQCCNRKFYKMYRVMQHCMWHENPETFKCIECSKCFADGVGLRDHMDFVHTPDEKRTYLCDLCPKSFLRKHMLTSHRKMQHISEDDKKFKCHICGQKFIIQAFLQGHIKKVHENADSRICDICAKFFKCSRSYELHYVVMHTDIQQKVQCELCGKWLKHKDSLKEHMRRHMASNEKCEFCGRISSNKKALRAHIRSAHTAASFPCTVCNKMFKKTQTLKEHMAIHTGLTDLYSCSFCPKTFRSNANMYSHRKRAHPVEYQANIVCGSKYIKKIPGEVII